jgi:hypothetical protein
VLGTRLPPVIDLRWRFWVMENLVRRLFVAIATAAAVLAAAGCTAATAHPQRRRPRIRTPHRPC